MALRLEDKKVIVAEVKAVAEQSVSAVVADYRGVNVSDMTAMRKDARERGVYVRVIKNTLAKQALKSTSFSCMDETFVQPTIVAFSSDEPSAGARLFKDFAKEHDAFVIRAYSIDSKLYPGSEINRLASLPNRHEALTQLASVLQAPVSKLARTLNEVPSKFARVVAQVRDSKQAA